MLPIFNPVVRSTSVSSFENACWTNWGRLNPLIFNQVSTGMAHDLPETDVYMLLWVSRFEEASVPPTYAIPPMLTIPSNWAVSRPASTASLRVSVNKTLGDIFMLRSSSGDVAVDFPSIVNALLDSIVPNVRPVELTVDWIFVMPRAAVKGFWMLTETWLILFSRPVVDRTRVPSEIFGLLIIKLWLTFKSGLIQ